MTIDSFTPAAPKPGDAVTITGPVTNTSTVTLRQRPGHRLHRRPAAGDPRRAGRDPAEDDKPVESEQLRGLNDPDSATFQELDELAPEGDRALQLIVPWEEWHIDDRPGVYVVGVRFRGNSAEGPA